MFNVDFNQKHPQVICHPEYQKEVSDLLEKLSPYELQNHFILFSSGTTGGKLKGYALSQKALFANAKAVNDHFGLTKEDVWGLSLPAYHIGGLSVLARAHLLGNKIIDARSWNPTSWQEKMSEVTITTVVPTQLYDLVKQNIPVPKNLRYLVVGGDLLNSGLRDEAIRKGWPVIGTFGMSEVCSQLASATRESDELKILPIHQIKIQDQRLLVKSEALFTLEFTLGDEFQVKLAKDLSDDDNYYITKDRASFENGHFKHLGRVGDEIKVSGHLVSLSILRETLGSYLLKKGLYNEIEITFEDDQRKGKKIVLLTTHEISINLQSEITALLHPIKIDEIRTVQNFKRTSLGKLKMK